MAGQAANCSVKEVVAVINKLETNQQHSTGCCSGMEKNSQTMNGKGQKRDGK